MGNRARRAAGLIVDEIHKCRGSGQDSKPGRISMRIERMRQSEAEEIADHWKYDGEYAFYDMTADPEDYEEIMTPEKRGGRYFSVFAGDELIGFFCVEREGGDLELGLGLRPDLTGQGRGEGFLREILRFVGDNDSFARIRISVASFNKRAIKVYERAGFVKTGTAQVPTNGGVYDFTLMEWKQKDEDKASDRA